MPSRNLVQHHGVRGAHGPNGGKLYAGIPTELARDGKLSYLARSVAMFVWSHDETWTQSAKAVAEVLEMDRGSVAKALAELQDRGWLVREIHQKVGPKGKPRTTREVWHLQMTNRRFTSDQIRELSAPSDVRATPAPSEQTCGPHPHGGAGDISTGGADETSTIGMELGMHPEVHSSNARKDLDETGLESRSLAVEGSEVTEGFAGIGVQSHASSGPDSDPWGGSTSEPATAGSNGVQSHASKAVASQPATATGSPFDDPFASEPAWLAESRAREERADAY